MCPFPAIFLKQAKKYRYLLIEKIITCKDYKTGDLNFQVFQWDYKSLRLKSCCFFCQILWMYILILIKSHVNKAYYICTHDYKQEIYIKIIVILIMKIPEQGNKNTVVVTVPTVVNSS